MLVHGCLFLLHEYRWGIRNATSGIWLTYSLHYDLHMNTMLLSCQFDRDLDGKKQALIARFHSNRQEIIWYKTLPIREYYQKIACNHRNVQEIWNQFVGGNQRQDLVLISADGCICIPLDRHHPDAAQLSRWV